MVLLWHSLAPASQLDACWPVPQHCHSPGLHQGGVGWLSHCTSCYGLPMAPAWSPRLSPLSLTPRHYASHSLSLLWKEHGLGNGSCQNTGNFNFWPEKNLNSVHPTCLHKANQLKIWWCIKLLQFLWIYSSNICNTPQLMETKKKNTELTIRKRTDRKISGCMLFTKTILLSFPLYKYDL